MNADYLYYKSGHDNYHDPVFSFIEKENKIMRTTRGSKASFLVAFAVVVIVLAILGIVNGGAGFEQTIWSLLPPVVAIGLALVTKEVYSSLFIGIVVGGLLVNNFAPVPTLDIVVNDGLVTAIADNAGIFLFLVILGIIVALVNNAGGSAAFGRWAEKHIKSKTGALIATFILGVLIFIDDYFNCLTVGSVMKPVTDRAGISRPKLAYLIDATAAPVCMIAPISSWAAAVSSTAEGLGTGISGIQLFVKAIPFNFYSLLTFVFIVAIAIMNFDYSTMKKFEQKAIENKDLSAIAGEETVAGNPDGKIIDLVLPVVVLIITCTIGMIYVGGFFGVDAWGGTDCVGDFIAAFGNTDAFIGLPWGGLIALIITIIWMLCRRILDFESCMACVQKGFNAMVSPIIILTMAVSLKTMTGALGAADFVHDLMFEASNSLYALLPAIIFIVGCILAFATGTSWGTFGILIPIVTAIFPTDSPLLMVGISACCAGAVCGDHCSPISDTTIMASAGAQCNHVDHVSTQLPYAITVAAISFVCYIIAGFVQNALLCLAVGAVLVIATLLVIKKVTNKAA